MNTPAEPALSIPEFALAYGLKESWVRDQVRHGVLKNLHHRMGKHVRFTESDRRKFEALTTNGESTVAAELSAQDLQKAVLRLAKARTADVTSARRVAA